MAKNDSNNALNDFFKKALTNQLTEKEIFNFINEINNYNNELLIFKILYILKNYKNLSPLLAFYIDDLFIQLFFSEEKEELKEKEEKVKKLEINIDLNKSLKDQFNKIKNYRSFPPEDNPNLIYPPKGQLGQLFFTEDQLIPGKQYKCEVMIDSEGNIADFVKEPIELYNNLDYEKIYAQLAGQLFNFNE